MTEKVKFLRNAWYVAALSTDVKESEFFSRKILGDSVLFYRKGNGKLVGLQDRCPHRFAPLSQGKREGDSITCIYHGLKFNEEGQCTHSPHGKGAIPKAACVKRYPVEERDGWVWIWPGDPSKADPDEILDCSALSRNPASSVAHCYMHNACNYELLTDNIMDLTHIDHLHGPFINTNGKLSPLIPNLQENGDSIRVRWDWDAHPAMLLFAMNQDDPEGPSKQFFEVNWYPPSNMTLDVGAVQGGSLDYHNDGLVLEDFHIMTPETEHSTHYFFASTRNYKMDDDEYNTMKMDGMMEAFTLEDKPLIEAQQAEMGTADFWSLKPVLLSSDAGAIRVRRKLAEMIEIENAVS